MFWRFSVPTPILSRLCFRSPQAPPPSALPRAAAVPHRAPPRAPLPRNSGVIQINNPWRHCGAGFQPAGGFVIRPCQCQEQLAKFFSQIVFECTVLDLIICRTLRLRRQGTYRFGLDHGTVKTRDGLNRDYTPNDFVQYSSILRFAAISFLELELSSEDPIL